MIDMHEEIIPRPTSIFKVIMGSSLGGCLELYDFVIYIFFAPILSHLFFPNTSHLISMLATFGVFAAGYLVRPIGGIIFGYYGDRYGRKKSLLFTLSLMGVCTILIGCLPTYQCIGVLAPILLTVLRVLQGISVGGDLPGAMTFVGEMSPIKSRGVNTSWIYFGVNCGNLLASAVASFIMFWLPHSDSIHSWSWRCGFYFGAIILIVGLYFRSTINESALFLILKQRQLLLTNPIAQTFSKKNLSLLIRSICFVWLWSAIIAQIFLYMPSYLRYYTGLSLSESLLYNTLNLVLFTCFIPVFGRLSDIVGRSRLGIIVSLAWIVLIYPSYFLITHHFYLLGLPLLAILSAAYVGICPALLAEIFPTNIRYTGIGTSYNLGFAIFGGLTPLVLSYVLAKTHEIDIISLNIIFAAVTSLMAFIAFLIFSKSKDRTGKELT